MGDHRRRWSAWAALVLLPGPALARQGDAPDPAPPTVRVLEPVQPPAPEDHPGLVVHGAPRPLAPGAVAEDWPGFLGPRRDGSSRETKLTRKWGAGGPPLLWTVERGQGYAPPALVGGRVVLTHRMGNECHVECLEAQSGRRYWRLSYPCTYRGRYVSDSGPRATPAISEGLVYVHGVEGMLHCLELATGRVVWKRDLRAEFGLSGGFFGVVASPLVHGELLILNLGAPGPTVAAFDKRTGRLVWGTGKEWGASCASPVIGRVHGRERLFVIGGGESRPPKGGLMVMDPADGALDFTYPFRSRTYESAAGASPLVVGNRVFLTASYNTGSAILELDRDGGFEERWRTRSLGVQFSNPVELGGRVWVVDGTSDRAGAVVSIDPATGKELSRTDLSWDEQVVYRGARRSVSFSVGEGSLLVVEERLLCLGDNGHLLWLEPTPRGVDVVARASLFRANESWSPPVLSRGLLYVCQNQREGFGTDPQPPRLLCFDLRGE